MIDAIEKAKRLLALKEGAATAGEAQAAAFALAKLLDKHRISMAEIESAGAAPAEGVIADEDNPLTEWGRAIGWKRNLIAALCNHYGVASWRRKHRAGLARDGRLKYVSAIHICGRPSDMDMVRYMYAWLSGEATRLCKSEAGGSGLRHANSWMLGFVDGIQTQLQAARAEAVKHTSSSVALVLRRRLDDAAAKLAEAIDPSNVTYYQNRGDEEARAEGKIRGKNHHLGQNLDAGAHRALPEASA